jgi:hypothetical protein
MRRRRLYRREKEPLDDRAADRPRPVAADRSTLVDYRPGFNLDCHDFTGRATGWGGVHHTTASWHWRDVVSSRGRIKRAHRNLVMTTGRLIAIVSMFLTLGKE